MMVKSIYHKIKKGKLFELFGETSFKPLSQTKLNPNKQITIDPGKLTQKSFKKY